MHEITLSPLRRLARGIASFRPARHPRALAVAAAFALVAQGQAAGEPAMAAYPPMAARGREFFVRSAAQIMDRAGLDRAAVAQLLRGEYEDLARGDMLDAVMPPCLLLLDASGL